MTRSVYVLGGAGVGKSTFTNNLLDCLGFHVSPLEDLHSLRNAKALVTLRGQRIGLHGMYLGVLRDSFPGTDGLDRASSPVATQWLYEPNLPQFIVAEGATLATRRFLGALKATTNLLIVHLQCDEDTRAVRFLERGSTQDPTFVKNTITRSANLVRDIACPTLVLDTWGQDAWDLGLDLACTHLDARHGR